MASFAVIIIGDEILSGKFADENTPYFIKRLRASGLDLRHISVIPDTMQGIAEEIAVWSKRVDWVLTTGGVGPTHDDMTFAAVAQGLGKPLVRYPELVEIIRQKFGPDPNEAALKMADLPEGSNLWWDGGLFFPQVVAGNVVIFPGVPSLVRLKFEAICWRFSGQPVHTARLSTLVDEVFIAATLTEAQSRWPGVAIGSYPRLEEVPHRVIVTMESRVSGDLDACHQWLGSHLPGAEPAA